jgi:hypothetical protein
VTREISDRGLVEASTGVDVNRVGNVLCRFRVVDCRMQSFVLTSWCEEQAPVRSERQTSEKRRKGFVKVYRSVANSETP